MSKYLGKIHYWLFNKIQWFENIEKEVISYAEAMNLPVSSWSIDIYNNYGKPTEDKPLEEIIDESNIHGWLQDKIQKAEARQAEYITRILKMDNKYENDLENIFYNQGVKDGESEKDKRNASTPEEVFAAINDYILEGMPCDRVNEFLESDDKIFAWRATTCLHSQYWKSAGGDVANFYNLRTKWIDAFVNNLTSEFNYVKQEDGTQCIIKKIENI